MTAPTVEISSLITCTPGVYGGRPCLAGTRYPVMEVAVHYNAGETPEAIAQNFGLLLSHVYAGVAHYLANREAVECDLAEDKAIYDAGVAAAGPGSVSGVPRSKGLGAAPGEGQERTQR